MTTQSVSSFNLDAAPVERWDKYRHKNANQLKIPVAKAINLFQIIDNFIT
jgi:hypothetical protein